MHNACFVWGLTLGFSRKQLSCSVFALGVILMIVGLVLPAASADNSIMTSNGGLSVVISPVITSVLPGQSFSITVSPSEGQAPYTVKWYVNQTLESVTSDTYSAEFEVVGKYFINATVTDATGLTVNSVPVMVVVSNSPYPATEGINLSSLFGMESESSTIFVSGFFITIIGVGVFAVIWTGEEHFKLKLLVVFFIAVITSAIIIQGVRLDYSNPYLPGDQNFDGVVNLNDVILMENAWGTVRGSAGYNPYADANNDGVVNLLDVTILSLHWGDTCSTHLAYEDPNFFYQSSVWGVDTVEWRGSGGVWFGTWLTNSTGGAMKEGIQLSGDETGGGCGNALVYEGSFDYGDITTAPYVFPAMPFGAFQSNTLNLNWQYGFMDLESSLSALAQAFGNMAVWMYLFPPNDQQFSATQSNGNTWNNLNWIEFQVSVAQQSYPTGPSVGAGAWEVTDPYGRNALLIRIEPSHVSTDGQWNKLSYTLPSNTLSQVGVSSMSIPINSFYLKMLMFGCEGTYVNEQCSVISLYLWHTYS
jgi:hypothetical protein